MEKRRRIVFITSIPIILLSTSPAFSLHSSYSAFSLFCIPLILNSHCSASSLFCILIVLHSHCSAFLFFCIHFISVLEAAVSKNILYGAYDNVLSTVGVSAMWAGIISSSDKVHHCIVRKNILYIFVENILQYLLN